MKIAIASDHAGVRLKALIQEKFQHVDFIDMGPFNEGSVDYPDFISKAASSVQKKEADLGIVICGSGAGASIVANKYKGIRAVLCFNQYMAEMSRRHNNANVLALGARVTGEDLAIAIVKTWLSTEFEGGRHQRRLDKITDIEKEQATV